MKWITKNKVFAAVLAVATFAGCSSAVNQSADVAGNIRKSLDQVGLKDVTVSQDRDKGVVTLGGHVATEGERGQAEFLTKPLAAGQVVAVEIAVLPVGLEKDAKAINSDVDKGIEKNLDAALIASKFHDSVKYEVRNSVVTLTGEVESQARRGAAERLASQVPYVKQVVNTVQVKNTKATSTL